MPPLERRLDASISPPERAFSDRRSRAISLPSIAVVSDRDTLWLYRSPSGVSNRDPFGAKKGLRTGAADVRRPRCRGSLEEGRKSGSSAAFASRGGLLVPLGQLQWL